MIKRTEQEIIQNWKGDITKPVVSVCCITYNHENYIEESIDSFLMQETDFPFEIVIGEDCSTDGTRKIIDEYIKEYPQLIRLVTSESNVGMNANFNRTMNSCMGKYIAFCEGDDYWSHPKKLQIQKDFLEQNKEYSMCYHNYSIMRGGFVTENTLAQKDSISFIDYLRKLTNIQTHTVFFRNILKPIIPKYVLEHVTGSYFIFLRLAEIGKLKYIDLNMAVYRIHEGGVWSGKKENERFLMALRNIDAMLMYYKNNKMAYNILTRNYICKSLHFFNHYIFKLDFKTAIMFFKLASQKNYFFKNLDCILKYYLIFLKKQLFKLSNKIKRS